MLLLLISSLYTFEITATSPRGQWIIKISYDDNHTIGLQWIWDILTFMWHRCNMSVSSHWRKNETNSMVVLREKTLEHIKLNNLSFCKLWTIHIPGYKREWPKIRRRDFIGNSSFIWVRSRNCGCLVTWFCYQWIAKPGNKTAAISWPDPYDLSFLRWPPKPLMWWSCECHGALNHQSFVQ